MQAVILIGGKGTRLNPITYTISETLVPLRYKHHIRYLVDPIRVAGLDGTLLSRGYLTNSIRERFAGQDLGEFSLDYAKEEYVLGTAGGIKKTPMSTWVKARFSLLTETY